MRAVHRRQQQQQQRASKTQRKSTTSSSVRRVKSSVAAATRHVTNTVPTPTQQTQQAETEPKVLTLSERLASIGRMPNTLNTAEDETPRNDESVQTKK